MVLKVVKYGDPVLETKADPITDFDTPELHKLVADMFDTMYASKGIGLAAPQVGERKQVTVIDISAGEETGERIVLINPQIVERSGSQLGEEGCLSIPGFREDVKRAMQVKVKAKNAKGEDIEHTAEELLSRCLQHEIDHLHGVLFLSHLSPLKRDLIRRKVRKLQKAGEW
jgi:peptide deformylase